MTARFKPGDEVRTISLENSRSGRSMQKAHDRGLILTVITQRSSGKYVCNHPELFNGPWSYDERDLELVYTKREDLISAHKEHKLSDQQFLERLTHCKEVSV